MPPTPRILILEDDHELLESLTAILTDSGYEVTPVSSGQQAVEAIAQDSYDLLVADIRMEGMSGLDAVEAGRRHQPGLATLIISGYATPENTARAMQLQAGRILSKPFTLKDFVSRVQEQLSLRQKTQARDHREQAQRRTLIWALQSMSNLLNLLAGDARSNLSQELSQRVAHQMGLSKQVSQEVGLASALLVSEERLGGIPDWFLQDTRVLPTLKYCLEHHDAPLDIDPPRVEARIVALALAIFDQDRPLDPHPNARDLSGLGLDAEVLEAYQQCLEKKPTEREVSEAQAD
ncbi:MAG: response regulator, partial [Candidatus Eremiobacteraeota bacterium]|nr:response regulator [Candidatus Eremiobacteraeota bacterium]